MSVSQLSSDDLLAQDFQKISVLPIPEEIDQLSDMQEQYQTAKALVSSFEARVKDLTARVVAEAPTVKTALTMIGKRGVLEVSKPTMKREILDIRGLLTALGPKIFLDIAKVNLTDLDKHTQTASLPPGIVGTKEGARTGKISRRT